MPRSALLLLSLGVIQATAGLVLAGDPVPQSVPENVDRLHKAARSGDLKQVQELIESGSVQGGVPVDARDSLGGDGALCKLGHGSGDVRGAPGSRIHGTRLGDQVRGLLPRAFRRISFPSGFGACDAGHRCVPGSP